MSKYKFTAGGREILIDFEKKTASYNAGSEIPLTTLPNSKHREMVLHARVMVNLKDKECHFDDGTPITLTEVPSRLKPTFYHYDVVFRQNKKEIYNLILENPDELVDELAEVFTTMLEISRVNRTTRSDKVELKTQKYELLAYTLPSDEVREKSVCFMFNMADQEMREFHRDNDEAVKHFERLIHKRMLEIEPEIIAKVAGYNDPVKRNAGPQAERRDAI